MKPGILSRRGFWLFITVVVWFAVFSMMSCTGEYHLNKARKKAPYLFDTTTVVKYDTVFKPKQIVDTLFHVRNNYDTVTIERERLRVRYVRLPGDTVYLEAECKEDTCINRVEYNTNTATFTKHKVPWWVYVCFTLLLLIILGLTFRR